MWEGFEIYAITPWGFSHIVINYKITFPEWKTRYQSNTKGQTVNIITYMLHKLKFIRILKRRAILCEHLSKEKFDAQFYNLGN